MISPRDLDNYRTLVEAQASDAHEIDDDSASATGAWSSSKFAFELAKLTAEFSLVTDYQNFTPVTGQPTSANPVVSLPRGSLPEGRALGYWMTVKKHSKLQAVQTIDYGPDSPSIWASGEFARWTQYISATTNGTPDFATGTASSSNSITSITLDHRAWNGNGTNSAAHSWQSKSAQYSLTTGVFIGTASTDVIVDAGVDGEGFFTEAVLGEWVQLKFPQDVTMSSFWPFAPNCAHFVFAGSMDGEQWYRLAENTSGFPNHLVVNALYTFPAPARVRYVRLIIINSCNSSGVPNSLGRAQVGTVDMNISTPFRRRHFHEIHRLDYLSPTFGNVALRPSETDRVAALDPANAASVSLSLVKSFHTEELSRAGNVVTHREADVVTGDFSDPVYTLPPGYYYIVTKLPAYDSAGEVVREGGWAINMAVDTLRKHVGVDHTGIRTLFSGDTAGGQVSTPGLKTALAMGSTTQLGPIVYPYVLANYRFQRVPPPPITSFALTAANSGSTVPISAGAPLTFTDSGGTGGSYANLENYWVVFDFGSSARVTVSFEASFSFEHSQEYAYDRLGIQSSSDGITFANLSVPWLQTSSTSSAPWSTSFGGQFWDSANSKNGWIVPRDPARATSLGWDNTIFTVPARYIRFWFYSGGSQNRSGWVAVLTRL